MCGKEIDNNIIEVEEEEKLAEDCAYIRRIKADMKNTGIINLERLRLEFIQNNLNKSIHDIEVIDEFVEFINNAE